MNLYEITNGAWGNSYVRVYAWAETEDQALAMAKENFSKEPASTFNENAALGVRLLFSSTDAPFATWWSDEGWVLPKLRDIP